MPALVSRLFDEYVPGRRVFTAADCRRVMRALPRPPCPGRIQILKVAVQNGTLTHALSIDVEDWYQSTIDVNAEITGRFERSLDGVLEALGQRGAKATFFVLGLAAEKAPQVVQRLVAAGHEVQSHGYGHHPVFEADAAAFRRDLEHAKALLEDLAGCEVFGYRAPAFSIDDRTPWAFDVLAETGHRYDSSVFPMRTSRYGIAAYPLAPQLVTTARGNRIVEAPIACVDWLGRRWPVGGGGYFRLWPYCILDAAFRKLTRLRRPGVVYFHPYEYDPSEMRNFRGRVSWLRRLHQGLGRESLPGKIDRLLNRFRFGPLRQVLSELLQRVESPS